MSNTYFKFKEFTIHQDKCAMKVSTDACIQGAWTPIDNNVANVLDIGTGTGLLSLMLAQQNDSIKVDAVELDKEAASQAVQNISESPWNDRITVHPIDIKCFEVGELYDMIICNPPFFQNSLQGEQAKRNIARHNDSLSYKDLLASFDRLLYKDGYASVMLPISEFKIWQDLLHENGWCVSKKLLVKPKQESDHNRIISICKRGSVGEVFVQELCIYEGGEYTEAFKEKLAPFYLKL